MICSQTQTTLQTTLRMSRPLFFAVICRSQGGLSANEKEEKFVSNDNNPFSIYFQSTTLPMLPISLTTMRYTARGLNCQLKYQIQKECQLPSLYWKEVLETQQCTMVFFFGTSQQTRPHIFISKLLTLAKLHRLSTSPSQ